MSNTAPPVNVSYQPYKPKRHSRTPSALAGTPPATPPTNGIAVPLGSSNGSGPRVRTTSHGQYLQPPRSPSPAIHIPAPVPVAPLPRSPSLSTRPTEVSYTGKASSKDDTARPFMENTKRPIVTSDAQALPTPSPTPEQNRTESDSDSRAESPLDQPSVSSSNHPESPSGQPNPLPTSRSSSVRSLEPEPLSPSSPSPSSSTAPPVRPGTQSTLTSRPGSRFRVVSNRVLNTQPARSSPLRPASHTQASAPPSHARTLSNTSTRSFFQPASPSSIIALGVSPSASAPVALASSLRENVPQRQSPSNRDKPLPSVNSIVPAESSGPRSTTPGLPRTAVPTAPSRSNTPIAPIPTTPNNQPVPYAVLSRPSSISPSPAFANGTPLAPAGGQRPAPYRAGFQPKGVYRHRTDEFEAARAKRSDAKRSEEKRLTRRLEKLIDLHFSPKTEKHELPENRRASSIFDLDLSELKGKSANELWRGVVESKAASQERAIRAAEQSITKWEEDKDVSACPICTTSFHPLTNRKHHCRLCGRVVCSLPPKTPNRPVTCSLLITADARTRKIEEVPDAIAYGVTLDEKERQGFLKGVRVCRSCRCVVAKQQHSMEIATAMLRLEAEIEEDLPQFQELVLSIKTGNHPTSTAETAAARKSLIDRFHEYDRLAKRLRALPCPPGGSQDRVQLAIAARANVFLQKNMFPLQTLPKMKQLAKAATESETQLSSPAESESSFLAHLDPGHAVQPLLEQEALLEQMLNEAQALRKIEDAQILKNNLREIREEIQRVVGG